MIIAPQPPNEASRLNDLKAYKILDTVPEPCFDDLTFLAAELLDAPISVISFVDEGRQWFKSRYGIDTAQTPRDLSFSSHVILDTGPFIIADASTDPRFHDNPLVLGAPHIRFFAAAPLINAKGHALGALCVIDRAPRTATFKQIEALRRLADQAMMLLELRLSREQTSAAIAANQRVDAERKKSDTTFRAMVEAVRDYAIFTLDAAGIVTSWNAGAERITGYRSTDILQRPFSLFFPREDVAAGVPAKCLQLAAEAAWEEAEGWRVRKDGIKFLATMSITRLDGGSGDLEGYACVMRDITQQKKSESEIQLTVERFRIASEAADIGFWDWNLTTDTLKWDDCMFKHYGHARSEAIQPYALWVRSLHLDDRARCEQEATDAINGLTPYDTTFRVVRTDGSIRHLKAVAKVIRDTSGNAIQMYGVNIDVTELTESRDKLNTLLQENSALLGTLNAHALVSVADPAGFITDANEAFCRLSGYSRDDLIGSNHRIVNSGIHSKQFWHGMWQEIASGRSWRGEVCNRAKDGSLYWVDSMITPFRKPNGQIDKYISIRFDITTNKVMEDRLQQAARYDKLTGLANRATFMLRLESAISRVRGGEQLHFAVLFLDFDRFKLVNDTLGHDAGDELLRQIAVRLRGDLRASDTESTDLTGNVVSRFGGDEFLLLINNLSATSDAIRIAERLLSALSPAYDIFGSEVHSSASIGIVTSDQSVESAEAAVSNADMAMYEAKRAGRGCSVVFNESMHARLARHVQIETSLRRAIGTAELSVVYQPIVELATGRTVSAEALVRWHHPVLGSISPAEFIPIAEESGLVIALDEWVLTEACAAMQGWRNQCPDQAPDTISVNLSRAELAQGPQFLERVKATLERTGLPPRCLQLEVTEREVMRNPESSRKLMQDLRSIGVKLAMDDFGTGTSSLGFLRDYPFDTIKIDKSFANGIVENSDVLAVIHATIVLVENLNMASLVEGIEDPSQVAILQSLGCRYAQGYLFSRPVGAPELPGAVSSNATRANIATGEGSFEPTS